MKIYHVKKSRKLNRDTFTGVEIPVGSEYFWTKARNRNRVISTSEQQISTWITNYRNSRKGEMTTNMEDWESRKDSIESEEEKEELIDEISEFLENKRANLENMPEQLQEGHMINEQIETLEELLEEVESIEIDE